MLLRFLPLSCSAAWSTSCFCGEWVFLAAVLGPEVNKGRTSHQVD